MNEKHILEAAGAFLLAAMWSLVAMPSMMTMGKRRGMVARPRLFSRRRRTTITYVGGLTIAAAVLLGFWLSGGLALDAVVIFASALCLLFLGLLDDLARKGIQPRVRLLIEAGISAAVWASGVGVEVIGVEWADAILTVFFLVAVTNAFNLLDNMDGITGATATAVALSIFGLAAALGQHLVAILAAALIGASLGFLRHNLRSARVYLGNGGALFLGFLLASTALKLELPLEPQWGFLALLAIFAVPETDTSLVIASRWLSGRPIFAGGTDHTSHRLVRLGLSPVQAAAAHAVASLVGATGVAAALATRRPGPLLLTIGFFALAGVALIWIRVYEPAQRRGPRRWIMAGGVGLAIALAPGVAAEVSARGDLAAARASISEAKSALLSGDSARARSALGEADQSISNAQSKLDSWTTVPARITPGVRGNIVVASALAAGGRELVLAGRDAIGVLDALPAKDGRLVAPWKDGALDLASLSRAAEPAQRIQRRVDRAYRMVSSARGVLLLPPIEKARREAVSEIGRARRQADAAVAATSLLPRLFGSEAERTWMIGAENTAELRGRGGYLGAFGVVRAAGGRLELGEFVPATELPPLHRGEVNVPSEYREHYARLGGLAAWANLGMSPNFPSAAKVLLTALGASGGPRASGVIGIDPVALGHLLEVTGPVQVKGVSEPLTASNVADWSLNGAYFEYEGAGERKERLADVVEAVWARLIGGADVDPAKLAEAVGRALAGRHMVVFSADPAEQRVIERIGIAGEIKNTKGDYLLVLGQNMGENKMDYYLERKVSYRAEVLADGSIRSRLEVAVTNSAPAGATLPQEVGGARPALNLEPSWARSYLSAFVPRAAVVGSVSIDGAATRNFDNRVELGKRALSTYVEVGPGETRLVVFSYRVPDVLDGGRYQLTLQNQATVRADSVDISVAVPSSAVVALREGFAKETTLRWKGAPGAHNELTAEIRVPLPMRLAAKLASVIRRPLFGVEPP